ncbi:helix-turn-helix domain-containing protein [Paraburkholderia madseniana]|uniref:helix-turn-helix domain-containing protein n=1 Tax=Paraburkholderia madseniana TaxID=2599607 RepID=UPI0039C9078E
MCDYIASRIRRERLARKISQAEFARQAGIPLRTYKRFEAHGNASLETFLRALKALGQTRYLYLLFPQVLPSKPTLQDRIEAIASRPKKRESA